VDLYGSQRTNR